MDRGITLTGKHLGHVLELDHASANRAVLLTRVGGCGRRQNTTSNATAPPTPITNARRGHPILQLEVDRVVERPTPRAQTADRDTTPRSRFIKYSQPSVGRRNTKKPALRWFVTNATTERPDDRTGGERREQPDDEHRARGELGEAGQPRVQDSRLHPEAREPSGGALDLAATVDVVVAVGEHRRAHGHPHDQEPEVATVQPTCAARQ